MHAVPYPREQAMSAWTAARHAAELAAVAAPAPRRQRVLMTADATRPEWQYALELGRALTAAGHEVALATTGGLPDREQRRETDSIAGLTLHASGYKPSPLEDCAERRASGRWLLDLAAAVRPSVLHLNGCDYADLPWKVPVLLAVHTCEQSWWRAVHGTPVPESWRWYRHHVTAALRIADVVVTPTLATLHGLHRHHGALGAARVIANGRDRANTPAPAKREYVFCRADPGDPSQNFAALEAAAECTSWPVCVASSGEGHGDVTDTRPGIRLLGRLSRGHAARWLERAPIYAMPARYAPACLSLHDAALARCALVLGDIEGLREIWDGAAIFVDPHDDEALAHALRRLIANKTARECQAELAFVRARRYSAAAMAAAYAAAYAEIAPSSCADLEPMPAVPAQMRC
jgi:glycogen synthase